MYRSQGKFVELEVTPLIRLTEDTPNANQEVRGFQRLCLAVFGDSDGNKTVEIQGDDNEKVPLSPLANARNFIGSGYGSKPNDDARLYFLDSLRMSFLTYPDTDVFERERFSAPEPFIRTIADGFDVENRGFALGKVGDLLKVIVSREMKHDDEADLREFLGNEVSHRPPTRLKEALAGISREFVNAFPIFSSAWVHKFSERGLLMGSDPLVAFQATGAEAEQLSESESRWFRLSLAMTDREPSLLLIDEPERGLDRNALREIARKLSSDWLPNTVILATSHSPSLLGISNSNAILIKDQRLIPYNRRELDDLAAYGIGPTDLVELHKAFIFVEGEHDKLILEHFFAEELDEMSATLIPFRGTKNLPHMTNWSFFIRSTECPLFIVVDNLNPEILLPAYTGAQQVFDESGYNEAFGYLQRAINPASKGSEEAAVVKVMAEAIQWAEPGRFIPTSLAKKDILMYLPEEIFGFKESWDNLYERFQEEREGKEDFKTWIRITQKIDVQNPEEIKRKLKRNDFAPHKELEALISTISSRVSAWQNSKLH
jgi:energy-coupling factor transporter ATP-binding protein EcfA2